ncbi:hypothetical protein shim_13950 [Shimia sp. SK013]|uniref:hypothetical protein n=1 Tax=Shimia sp. SK013 TaxID=1389006 RepID=UPI0006B56AEA|nr:hypothetical protein [Shimia sp. SK013]KPA23101.1 hypothetical protein shim_13950 [Shimia sp. SK013]
MTAQKLIAFVVAATVATPALAQKSQYRNPVADAGSGSFAVVNKWASRDDDIWCAAARAARERGAAWKDRLYVTGVTSAAQSQYGSETITFTLRPTQELLAQGSTGRSSVRGVGNSLTLNSANRRCQRELDFF